MKAMINEAIRQHGARAVYEAAHRHAAGDTKRGLERVGLVPKTMGDVWGALSEAYAQMGDADRAIENAQASARIEQ